MIHVHPDSLVEFVDGKSSVREAARVAAHLETCQECARVVYEHRSVKRLLAAGAVAVAIPTGLSARVNATLDALPPPVAIRRWPLNAWKGPLSLSIAALIATTGIWFARSRPSEMDVAALVSVHRHAYQPPAGQTLMTPDVAIARTWLGRRLGVAPPAPSLRLPLAGVGACHVGDAPAAIWIYRGPQPVTLIDVYTGQQLPDWPRVPKSPGAVSGTYGGYNAIVWSSQRHTYGLVSRLPTDQMARLLESSP